MLANEELKKDLSFDATNVEDKLSRIPNLAVKWHDKLNEAKLTLAKLEISQRNIRAKWWKYYCGHTNNEEGKRCPLVLDKKEILDFYLPDNPEVVDNHKRMEVCKAEIREYENATKQVTQLYWSMKTWIEWRKFEAGA